MTMLRAAGKMAAAAVPAAELARLGLPALIAVCVLAVLVLAAGCWVLSSDARCERAATVLGAWRGTSPPEPPPMPPAARRRWPWQRPAL